jgi:hypothetical protein
MGKILRQIEKEIQARKLSVLEELKGQLNESQLKVINELYHKVNIYNINGAIDTCERMLNGELNKGKITRIIPC